MIYPPVLGLGFADITGTATEETLDLTAWKGRNIRVQVEIADFYVGFSSSASVPAMDVDAAALDTLVPLVVRVGDTFDLYVALDKPHFKYRTITGTGTIRIIRIGPAPETG